jgi:hypothetical protein
VTKIQNYISSIGLNYLKFTSLFYFLFTQANAQTNDTLIWRSIPISNGKALKLESSVDELSEILTQDKKRTYHLNPGTFAGADSITIEIDNKNRIKSLSFFYSLTMTFEQHLEMMEGSLKKPVSLVSKENKKIATWQDQYSRFKLIWIKTRAGKTILYSVLEDL